MSRQTHTKSRSGCRTCKARKCDEERPVCRNCNKRGAQCEFDPIDRGLGPDTFGTARELTLGSAANFSMSDMQLLHHYTISTSLTFSNDSQARVFWRINVPQIGFSNPFVMKSILAVTAQHYAHVNQERKDTYLKYAVICHEDSSSTMQVVPKVTEENYPALLSFTWLNIYFAFARPKSLNFLVVEEGMIPDWLVLFRGVRNMTAIGDYTRYPSVMNVLMSSAIRVNHLWETCSYENEAFDDLLKTLDSHVEEACALQTLHDAVQALKRSYALVFDGAHPDEFKLRAIFIWLFKMSDDYMDLLKNANGEALCVLAFFCVLLQRLDHYWWMQGWAWHLIKQIHTALKPEQQTWIQWPVEEIGWAPVT